LQKCIYSGVEDQSTNMLRLVVGPGNNIYFDMKQKLPGRAIYMVNSKILLTKAIEEKTIERIFDKAVVSIDLPSQFIYNYLALMLSIISLAKKAGKVILGKRQIEEYMASSNNAKTIIIQASDASEAEKFKRANVTILDFFSRDDLSKACGKENLVYVVIQDRFATWLEDVSSKYEIYMRN
jgi:predicted RNA-binding protein YlxR (DUF448 family)/ribosomal protein L7Ae-like RNA K-turn-binding protein